MISRHSTRYPNLTTLWIHKHQSAVQGPFATFKLNPEANGLEWTGMQFSPDGKSILISTNGGILRVVDAFQGTVTHTLSDFENSKVDIV